MAGEGPNFTKGYVVVKVIHPAPERFLNMCAHHGICLYDLKLGDKELTMKLELDDFYRLRPLVKKSGVRIRILEKHGLPFFFYRNKKRKAFFVGILACFCLIFVLSAHIWNIHVEGNQKISTQVILEFLEQNQIRHGIPKSRINCSQVAAAIRKNFPDVTWVSAKIVGTRLKLTIQENTDRQLVAVQPQEKEPCSIVADKAGTIVKMVTKRGVPQMFPGQECKKGDLLVSGCLEIINDSQEVVRYEYVPAQADIVIHRSISYKEEFPLVHQEKEFTGQTRSSWGIQLNNYRAQTGFLKKGFTLSDQVYQEIPVYLTENFRLPFTLFQTQEKEFQNKEETYTQEEAKALAAKNLENFQKKLIEKGVQIYENSVTIETNDTTCSSHGTIIIEETIGKEIPVEQKTVPAERMTAEDEQQHH